MKVRSFHAHCIAHIGAAVVHVGSYVDVLLKLKFSKEFDSNTKVIDCVFAPHDSCHLFFLTKLLLNIYVHCAL